MTDRPFVARFKATGQEVVLDGSEPDSVYLALVEGRAEIALPDPQPTENT